MKEKIKDFYKKYIDKSLFIVLTIGLAVLLVSCDNKGNKKEKKASKLPAEVSVTVQS